MKKSSLISKISSDFASSLAGCWFRRNFLFEKLYNFGLKWCFTVNSLIHKLIYFKHTKLSVSINHDHCVDDEIENDFSISIFRCIRRLAPEKTQIKLDWSAVLLTKASRPFPDFRSLWFML